MMLRVLRVGEGEGAFKLFANTQLAEQRTGKRSPGRTSPLCSSAIQRPPKHARTSRSGVQTHVAHRSAVSLMYVYLVATCMFAVAYLVELFVSALKAAEQLRESVTTRVGSQRPRDEENRPCSSPLST